MKCSSFRAGTMTENLGGGIFRRYRLKPFAKLVTGGGSHVFRLFWLNLFLDTRRDRDHQRARHAPATHTPARKPYFFGIWLSAIAIFNFRHLLQVVAHGDNPRFAAFPKLLADASRALTTAALCSAPAGRPSSRRRWRRWRRAPLLSAFAHRVLGARIRAWDARPNGHIVVGTDRRILFACVKKRHGAERPLFIEFLRRRALDRVIRGV